MLNAVTDSNIEWSSYISVVMLLLSVAVSTTNTAAMLPQKNCGRYY